MSGFKLNRAALNQAATKLAKGVETKLNAQLRRIATNRGDKDDATVRQEIAAAYRQSGLRLDSVTAARLLRELGR